MIVNQSTKSRLSVSRLPKTLSAQGGIEQMRRKGGRLSRGAVLSWGAVFFLTVSVHWPLRGAKAGQIIEGATNNREDLLSCEHDGTCRSQEELYTPEEKEECGLYIAESTVPNAGVGIFTTVARQAGEDIDSTDVCIPLVDLHWNNPIDAFNPFEDYYWDGAIMGMLMESTGDDIFAMCPGMDSALSSQLGLINVERTVPVYDDYTGLHRAQDPGAGAISPYLNGGTIISRDIPEGGELFKFYGDSWFATRSDRFGQSPLSRDYPAAESLLRKMADMQVDHSLSEDVQSDIYALITGSINSGQFESRTLNALPTDIQDAVKAAAKDLASVQQSNHVRPLEWLRQHGRCVDHLYSGDSTLPQAGRGAFVKRNMKEGAIVTTSPLHHLPNWEFLQIYNFTRSNDGVTWLRLIDEVRQYQLMLNYCYGDMDTSTILLCPFGPGVSLINHNQTLANVRIQWASGNFPIHNHSLVVSGKVEDLEFNYRPQLAFDYVAIRDLKAGEEIFLDYGDTWELAWQEHLEAFHEAVTSEDEEEQQRQLEDEAYASAHIWNTLFEDVPIRTEKEQRFDPYPENLGLRCADSLLEDGPIEDTYDEWILTDYGTPCRIIERFRSDDDSDSGGRMPERYTVLLEDFPPDFDNDEEESELEESEITWIEKTDVPRSAIRFFDVPGTSDMHLATSFRHEIGIPEDMFPEQWRNIEPFDDEYDEYDEEYDGYESDYDEDEQYNG